MSAHPSHAIKVLFVILALAISSLIFGISAAGYYTYPETKVTVRRINSTSDNASPEKYKNKAKNLFDNLNQIVKDNHPDAESLNNLKTELMSLVVPKEFMNLHIGLVLVADKLIDYNQSRDKKTLQQVNTIMTQAKKQYTWLN